MLHPLKNSTPLPFWTATLWQLTVSRWCRVSFVFTSAPQQGCGSDRHQDRTRTSQREGRKQEAGKMEGSSVAVWWLSKVLLIKIKFIACLQIKMKTGLGSCSCSSAALCICSGKSVKTISGNRKQPSRRISPRTTASGNPKKATLIRRRSYLESSNFRPFFKRLCLDEKSKEWQRQFERFPSKLWTKWQANHLKHTKEGTGRN